MTPTLLDFSGVPEPRRQVIVRVAGKLAGGRRGEEAAETRGKDREIERLLQ